LLNASLEENMHRLASSVFARLARPIRLNHLLLAPAACLLLSFTACTRNHSLGAAGGADAGGTGGSQAPVDAMRADAIFITDAQPPSDGFVADALSTDAPSDAAAPTCTENGVTYHAGDVVPRTSGTCVTSCVCLSDGSIGRCTGACPEDAGSDGGGDAIADPDGGSLASACLATMGQIESGLCCTSATDFPNTCAVGACGCSPANSHTISQCACASGCFLPPHGCAGPSGVCTVGDDATCNDDPATNAFHGSCIADGRCVCTLGGGLAASGRCH
jgi:hypothetical protein